MPTQPTLEQRLQILYAKGPAKRTPEEDAEYLFLDTKVTYDGFPQFETYEEFKQAKDTNTLGTSTKTAKGRERAAELTPERIEEIFLVFAQQKTPITKKAKEEHWVWTGSYTAGFIPHFGQARFDPNTRNASARRYAYNHFIGFTPIQQQTGMKLFQQGSCPEGCVNPYHMLVGSKSRARQL